MEKSMGSAPRKLLCAVGATLAVGCAEVGDAQPRVEEETLFEPSGTDVHGAASVALALDEAPAKVVDVARALLEGVRGTDVTPDWSEHAELGEDVYPYLRPDMEGPAYYEFTVNEGGRIVVASGPHDTPIPHFSDQGSALALSLVERAERGGEKVRALYRLGDGNVLATNAQGLIVAHVDRRPMEQGVHLEEYLAMLEAEADLDDGSVRKARGKNGPSYQDEWDALYEGQPKSAAVFEPRANVAVKDIKWLYHADLLRSYIRWEQHDVDPSPTATCWAGCGPVAVAQVAAYLAYSERWGNPKYQGSNSTKLFPNVSTRKDSPEVRRLIGELHTTLKSFCWNNVLLDDWWWATESAAAPWNMGLWVGWAKKKGANVKYEDSWGGYYGGDDEASWNAIRRGNPVIFGWKFQHYNVGVGVGMFNNSRYVWVNNGQGDGYLDGWMRQDGSFYTGIVHSWVAGK